MLKDPQRRKREDSITVADNESVLERNFDCQEHAQEADRPISISRNARRGLGPVTLSTVEFLLIVELWNHVVCDIRSEGTKRTNRTLSRLT
jgi:hypothetical protein